MASRQCRTLQQHALRSAVLGALVLVALARPLPKLAEPDYTLYHKKDGVFQAVREIVAQCPSIMRIDEESESDGNYTSTLTVVTVEPAGLSAAHDDKARLLLNFGEHGRELISSEIGLHVLRLLCDEAARRPLLDKYGVPAEAVQQLLQRAVFKIVPMENVRGRERVEAGELCERKNGRGVDPNRNWEVHWGFKEKDYDPREEYPGLKPFSEPEAALMLRTARALRPHVWVSVHSGMEALFMPYDHKATIPEGEGPAATLAILKQLNQRTCKKKCAVGSGGKSVGYLAHGTATDYMFERLGVPISMTWEVYGDQRAAFEDCFRMFNPLTREVFNSTVESWTAAVFTMLTLLPQHPQIEAELHLLGGPQLTAGGAASSEGSAAGRSVAADAAGTGGAATSAMAQHTGPENSGGQEQQQQQQQQQQQHVDTGSLSGETSQGTGASSSSSGSVDSSGGSAGKAMEIASALKAHMQQQEGEAAADAQQQQAQQATQQSRAGAAGRGGDSGKAVAPRRSRVLATLYLLTVLVTGCVVASYLWSKPRVRYQLSKWLGSSRRRARGVIPL